MLEFRNPCLLLRDGRPRCECFGFVTFYFLVFFMVEFVSQSHAPLEVYERKPPGPKYRRALWFTCKGFTAEMRDALLRGRDVKAPRIWDSIDP